MSTLPSASADWLQHGGDAARTGSAPGAAPREGEVALVVRLPAPPAAHAVPLVVGRHAYVPVDAASEERPLWGVAHVDLATASVTLVPSRAEPRSIASDGTRLFLATRVGIESFAIQPDGALAPSWHAAHPAFFHRVADHRCPPPVVGAERLYVACVQAGTNTGNSAGAEGARMTATFVYATHLAEQTREWVWAPGAGDEARGTGAWPSNLPQLGMREGTQPLPVHAPRALSLVDDVLVLSTTEDRAVAWVRPDLARPGDLGAAGTADEVVTHWGLDADTGFTRWAVNSSRVGHDPAHLVVRQNEDALQYLVVPPAPATGGRGFVYLKTDDLLRVTTASARVERVFPLGAEDSARPRLGASLSFGGGALFATSLESVYRISHDEERVVWRVRHLREGQVWSSAGLLRFGDEVAGLALNVSFTDSVVRGSEIYMIGASDGSLRWTLPTRGVATALAAADGALLALHADGNLTVLGRAPGSMVVLPHASSAYPPPRSAVAVDLAGSKGAQGNATLFRAAWGDGAITEWTNASTLEHTYAAVGNFTARFYARNDAGQQSWVETTFFVGGTPPPPPTDPFASENAVEAAALAPKEDASLLRAPFAQENAEVTFFLLGLLITVAGALFGVLRLKRKRDRLKEELRQLAEEHAATRHDARACEAMLARRRARARKLLLDGRLDEGQVVILDRRIDELVHALRLDVLDSRFDWLPHGTVKALRGMVQDGRFTAWEHEHALTLVQTDPRLSDDQRAAVRELLAAWFDADSGAQAAPAAAPAAG